MKSRQKKLIRVVLFSLIFILLLGVFSNFFQPVWTNWNNYHTVHGFYEQPEDSIEILFVGASTIINAVTSVELYDTYGMCAYSLATEQQPMLATYYWLEEAYRLHGESLKTVVLDPSQLYSKPLDSFYHKALDAMHLSEIKVRAIYDYTGGKIDKTLAYLFPLATYHDRWSSLEEIDFTKQNLANDSGTRGYNFTTETVTDRKGLEKVPIKNPVLDTTANNAKRINQSVIYFEKVVSFCKDKGLKLVLAKTPAKSWDSDRHNDTASLAEQYGLELLDYNFNPLYEELGYIHAFDSYEGTHMNYYGATKFTGAIGRYLAENTEFTDVRNDDRYAFMKEQSELYRCRVTQKVDLRTYENVIDYLTYASKEGNTVIITVKEEAAEGLSDQEKKALKDMGLTNLSTLEKNDSYIGVIENGVVVCDKKREASSTNKNSLTYRHTLPDGNKLIAVSGGRNHGKVGSCKWGDEEYAENERGLNIVVYNSTISDVVDSACFDTHVSGNRETLYGLDIASVLEETDAINKYDPDSVQWKVLWYQQQVDALS